jgi:NADH-quinone oxidoreductase subunit N
MTVPKLDFNIEALLPEIIIAVLAIVLLMLDLFMRGRQKRILTWVSLAGYAVALAVCLVYFFALGDGQRIYAFGTGLPPNPGPEFTGAMLVQDHLAYFFRILAILTAMLGTLFAADYIEERGMPLGEFYAVLALLTLGAMLVGASVDLIMIFLGIELMSISTYILTGFARKDKLSNEGALKYFLLGTFATAILVYGMAWLYGMTGSTNLVQIANRVAALGDAAGGSGLTLAIVLLVVGLGFKIAAVPFHMWTPDAYQGAPTPVTAIMSVGPKAAGFAAIVRILIEGLGPAYQQWLPLIIVLSILTMTLGNVVGLMQNSVKRMLAYSSIAHTGYLLIGVAAFQPGLARDPATNDAVASILFYLFSYVIMNIGAFGLVVWLQHNRGTEFLDDFRGLSSWAPGPAFMMMVLLLSLTGIPPTIGFFGKYYVFVAALRADLGWLAVLGVLNSAIAAFYYLRIIWYMYFEQPRAERAQIGTPLLVGGLALTAVLVFVFFVAAGPVIDMARQALPLVPTVVVGR